MARYLIVNADDFGLSTGVNQGIIQCAERGILTSASLMVRWPAAIEAAEYTKQNSNISVGLHIDLGEWVLRDEQWETLYRVVEPGDAAEVEKEIYRQLSVFRHLVGADPTHLDSHQHVHRNEPAQSVMMRLAGELRVPLREFTKGIQYRGDFYGQGAAGELYPELLTVSNMTNIFSSLVEDVTELGCHPGYGEGLISPYCVERRMEVEVLCDPTLKEELAAHGLELTNFRLWMAGRERTDLRD